MKDTRRPSLLDTDREPYVHDQTGTAASPEGRRDTLTSLRLLPEDGFGDRRKAVRQLLSGFAVIHSLDPDGRKGRYRVAQLRDISTTGIGLRLNAPDPGSFMEGREFEILFQFSEHAKPRHMTCTTCRCSMDEAGMVIGAIFRNPLRSLGEIECHA